MAMIISSGAIALVSLFVSQTELPVGSVTAEPTVASRNLLSTAVQGAFGSEYDLTAHQTLSRVIVLIREKYVDPLRVKPDEMFKAALNQIEKTIPEVIVEGVDTGSQIIVRVGAVSREFKLEKIDQLWEITMALQQIFRFLQSEIEEADRQRDIEYAAINGMLRTLDPHSVLLRPENFDEVKLSTRGEFGGLGIVISIRDGALTVVSPISGTPAAREGLKARDQIVKIGEESTINMGLEEAVSRLRGKPGTAVDIWIQRKGWNESKKFRLVRAIIKIQSVTSKLMAKGVGYIKIKNFQGNTYDDLDTHLKALKSENKKQLKGLVLDLRNNPGGLLDQAILISDRFIEEGALVITVGEGNRTREVKSAHFSGTETGYPVVVLVNAGSASASEIVAGAIKNQNRGIVLGQQTFGKGSVQVLYDFKDDSALKLTIAQYLTPGDVSIQSVGIEPDIEVWLTTVSDETVNLFWNNETPREKDLQQHLIRHPASAQSLKMTRRRIVHLMHEETEKKPEEETGMDEFMSDFEIELAHQILAETKVTKRSEILKQAQALMAKVQDKEEAQIAFAMKKLGVDWSKNRENEGLRAALTNVEATLQVECGGKKDAAECQCGDEVKIVARVTNRGSSEIHRLFGVTNSENPFFRSLEFPFGYIKAGGQKSWSSTVKIPKGLSRRADNIELQLGIGMELAEPVVTERLLKVNPKARPVFAYQFRLDDTKGGNGDGVLQVGEEVDFVINVANEGLGDAPEAMLALKNLSGQSLFLDVGRQQLGEFNKLSSKVSRLHFSIRSKPDKDTVKLRLSIWDNELGVSLSDVIELPVLGVLAEGKTGKALEVEKQALNVYAGADEKMPILGYLEPQSILVGNATFGQRWIRFKTPKFGVGFVDSMAMTRAKNARRQKLKLLKKPNRRPPVVHVNVAETVTKVGRLNMPLTVKYRGGLRDLYIFVNDKKVFYQAVETKTKASNFEESTLELNPEIMLEPGTNHVLVVVRSSEDLVGRRMVGFYYDAPR